MGLYNPDYIFEKTIKITPQFLHELGIENLLLDVDNTLATHGNPVPAQGIEQWVETMHENGIKLMIVSNNYEKRVKPFAQLLGLPFSSFSAKPLPFGFYRAMKKMGGTKKNTAVVGDQILTDILGGHLFGIKTIMVLAILEEGTLGFKIKRKFEKKYIKEYIDKNGGVL